MGCLAAEQTTALVLVSRGVLAVPVLGTAVAATLTRPIHMCHYSVDVVSLVHTHPRGSRQSTAHRYLAYMGGR